uniref:Uncharacterized protein n=1 Tax=Anguilla anguilla TaxID=7936 RepID=A0A0E9RV52_ANGAN
MFKKMYLQDYKAISLSAISDVLLKINSRLDPTEWIEFPSVDGAMPIW